METSANIQNKNNLREILEERKYVPRVDNGKFTFLNVDKPTLYIGTGTCGRVAGAVSTLEAMKEYLLDRDLDIDIVETGCLGLCSLEPLVSVQLPGKNRILYGNMTADKVPSVLDDVLHSSVSKDDLIGQFVHPDFIAWPFVQDIGEMPFFNMQKRNILRNCGLVDPCSLDEYVLAGGYTSFIKAIKNFTCEEICDLVEQSDLRGRAGGGYNTGKKWKIALKTAGNRKYLICNAEESDPGAFMDRTIIEGNPHLLIEGMAIAAYSIGADKAYVYIRSEYEIAIARLEEAIKAARTAGLIGHNVFGSGFSLDIILRKGPGAFVCGEETAMINSLEGKRGMPQTKPPYPAVKGLYHSPTIINNVETLSNIPAIINHGADWFKQTGTPSSKGTKIFAISGKIKHTGLIEVPMGTTIRDIVFTIAGGIPGDKEFKALFLGGPLGYCLDGKKLDTRIDYEELKNASIGMGSGGMVVVDEDTCIIDMMKYFMDFMQRQSCGKCIPCREGTKRIAEILESITKKPLDENKHTTLERFKGVMQLESLSQVMKDTSLCGLGQHSPNPVLSTLLSFRDEYEEHIFERTCRAGTCRDLRKFRINVDSCTGCTICAKKCPVNAIIGTKRSPFFIVEDKCTGCGLCYESCKFNAVEIE